MHGDYVVKYAILCIKGREGEQGSAAALCHRARSRAATAAAPDRPAASQPPPVVDRTEREGGRNREIVRERRWGQGLAVASPTGAASPAVAQAGDGTHVAGGGLGPRTARKRARERGKEL